MRRLVVPLTLLLVLIGLIAGSAQAQFPPKETNESLGFLKDLKGGPGDTVQIPIYLRNDSTVTGLQFGILFDHNILQPFIKPDGVYQAMVDSFNAGQITSLPDSTAWDGNGSEGLWYLYFVPSDSLRNYGWDDADRSQINIIYNLNERDSIRAVMSLNPLPPVGAEPAYIPPQMRSDGIASSGDTAGVYIGTIPFRVNPDAEIDSTTELRLIEYYVVSGTSSSTTFRTQFSEVEEHPTQVVTAVDSSVTPYDTTYVDTVLNFDVTNYPTDLLDAVFTVDTTGGGTPTDENQLPVVATITPNAYTISQGELVSFAVTATDEEGGVVTLRANGGSLTTPNASFGVGGVVTGANGLATGNFSFRPALGQEGTFAFAFQAEDDSGAVSNTQVVTVIVEGFDEDILFTTSSEEYQPSGGVPGFSDVVVPIGIVTEKTIYGIQFDVEYNDDYFLLDSIYSSDRTDSWEIFQHSNGPGEIRVITFGLANDSMVPGSTSAALYMAMSVDEFAEPGCYALNLFDGFESIDPDPNVAGLELVTDSGIMCVDQWGDINLDRDVNVADLVSAVGYILNNFNLNGRQFAAGDVVPNDTLNVVDLVGIINVIFELPISPDPSPVPSDQIATLKVWHDEIPWAGIESEVNVDAEIPLDIAGVQLDVSYNPNAVEMLKPQLAESTTKFNLYSSDNGNGSMKVIIYSSSPWDENTLIPEGLADIVKLPFVSKTAIPSDDTRQVRVSRAFMTTGAAKDVHVEGVEEDPILPDHFELYQNRPNPFNPTTEIDFYIDGSMGAEHVTLEVFNILGQTVKTLMDKSLEPGQYSVIWDGTDDWGEKAASGVYLYRLKVGDAGKTKKMVLLK